MKNVCRAQKGAEGAEGAICEKKRISALDFILNQFCRAEKKIFEQKNFPRRMRIKPTSSVWGTFVFTLNFYCAFWVQTEFNLKPKNMNESANFSSIGQNFRFGNFLYVVTGTLGTVFNAIIAIAILKSKHLRCKENLLVAGLAFFSLIYGLFYLSIGIFRLNLSDPFAFVPVTYCLKFPQSIAVIFAPVGCTCMLFMLALDRFIAAHYFQKYLTLKKRAVFIRKKLSFDSISA